MPAPVWDRLSIRTKIIALVSGTLVVAQVVTLVLIRSLVNGHIVAQKVTVADVLTTSILHDIKYDGRVDLRANGPSIIAKYTTYYRDITHMTLYDESLQVVASSDGDYSVKVVADPEILAAARGARPSLHARRSSGGDLEIRSVAPIMRGSRIGGTLDLDISIRDVHATLAAIDKRIALIMTVKLAFVTLLLLYLLRTAILKRLGQLMLVTRSIAAGHYDTHAKDTQQDEIGSLARAFNTMADEVKRSKLEIEAHNRDLQRRVQEATGEVVRAYDDLKSAQSQLVLNEKMASLGVLIAGIAHEINTPVGAILNVSRSLDRSVRGIPKELEWLREDAGVPFETIQACLAELVGAAGAAATTASHRDIQALENVLRDCGVENYRSVAGLLAKIQFMDLERVRQYAACFRLPSFAAFAESIADIAQAAKISETSSQKIGEIVRALKYYAYSDKDRVDRIQVNDSIQTALVLLRSQLKHTVEVSLDFDPGVPPITCSSDIHQVWTNLLTNAVDAVKQRSGGAGGRIEIGTRKGQDSVLVTVADNGCGIPQEIIGKVFDPFFTTKDIGSGTGLGLCIVAGIVKRHGGTIGVESRPGRTVFTVQLPLTWNPETNPVDGDSHSLQALGVKSRRPAEKPMPEAA